MNRIIYYYQTFIGLDYILSNNVVTHIHLSSIHFGVSSKGIPCVHLNDNEINSNIFEPVWKDCRNASQKGIKIILMIGGAGGAYYNLFNSFDVYYPLLKQFIQQHDFINGVDLDIEEEVSLSNVKMFIRTLKNDFGENFIITTAPLGDSLMNNSEGMGGFIYKDLYNSSEGKLIDYFNGQFYDSFTFEAYDKTIKNGYPQEKIVIGMQSCQFNEENFEIALNEISKIKQVYPNFGGVFNWEYFDSPPNKKKPVEWACEMNKVIKSFSLFDKFLSTISYMFN